MIYECDLCGGSHLTEIRAFNSHATEWLCDDCDHSVLEARREPGPYASTKTAAGMVARADRAHSKLEPTPLEKRVAHDRAVADLMALREELA